MGEKSAAAEMKHAAESGVDCFGMTVAYLQGRSYCGKFADLDEAQEGDVLLFTGKDGACLVLYRGNGRGYSVAPDGRPAMLRIRDLLIGQRFLAGVRFGR